MKEKESLTKKTFQGFLYMSLGTGSQFLLQFLVLIILSRLLSPEDFGLVSIGILLISFLSILSTIGVGPAIIQRKKLSQIHITTGFTISIFLNLILALLLFLISPLISVFFSNNELTIILRLFSLIFIFQGVSIVAESLMTRELNIKLLAKIRIISYAIYGLTGVLLASFDFGMWALVFANLLQFFSQSLLLILFQPHKKRITFNLTAAKDLLYFGGGFSIARVFNHIALEGDNFMVGKLLGAEALGYYNRAYQLIAVPISLFGRVIDIVLFPALSKVQDKDIKLITVYLRGIAFISIVSIPISILIIYTSPLIVNVLFGPKWFPIVEPVSILAAGIIFRTSYKYSDALIAAKGAVYRRAKRQVLFAFFVLLNSWIGHFWGITGVSYGILFSLIINYFMMSQLSINILHIKWSDFIKAQISGIKIGIATVIFIIIINNIYAMFIFTEYYILILSTVTIIPLVIGIILLFPKYFLSKEDLWIIEYFKKQIIR